MTTMGQTEAEFRAACPGAGLDAADCNAAVQAQYVNGAWCDGDVYMSLDASGAKQKQCIPRAVVAQKDALLVAPAQEQKGPMPLGTWALYGAGAVGAAALLWWALR